MEGTGLGRGEKARRRRFVVFEVGSLGANVVIATIGFFVTRVSKLVDVLLCSETTCAICKEGDIVRLEV